VAGRPNDSTEKTGAAQGREPSVFDERLVEARIGTWMGASFRRAVRVEPIVALRHE
jgi:hypothetical protein